MQKIDLSRYNHVVFLNLSLRLKYALWLLASNFFFLTNIPYPNFLKVTILRIFGAKIGKVAVIKPWVKIKFPWLLTLGDHVWLGENCWIDNLSSVSIGSHVCISQSAMLITGNHDYSKIDFPLLTKPIVIHDGVWVGAKSVVFGGVVLNTHSVLTLSSVATKDLEAYTIYQGNPAVKIKDRLVSA
jgi:putative colanic acid biosynthesis acetyltransferase WcaF